MFLTVQTLVHAAAPAPTQRLSNKLRRCKIRTLNQKHKNVLFFLPPFQTCFRGIHLESQILLLQVCVSVWNGYRALCFLLAAKHSKWQLNILHPWKEQGLRRQLHVGIRCQEKACRSDLRNRSVLLIHFTHKNQWAFCRASIKTEYTEQDHRSSNAQ